MDLTALTAIEQAELVRSREVSAEELLNATLSRIDAVDGRPGSSANPEEIPEDQSYIHAFVHVCREEALAKAREVDRKIAAGEMVGPLAGVPYSAKDVCCTRGIPTEAGSRILQGWVPPYQSTVIERMEMADAVLIGKTNCDEFAMGGTDLNSACLPRPRNPRDLSRVPGGSSGGSAAAVASFQGAVSLGTDTGGSIREPAAFCGVVGLKPTYGSVSRYGIIPLASSMDTPGPITRSNADAALILSIIAGFDSRDNTSRRVPIPDYLNALRKGVKGMRVGISPDLLRCGTVNPDGSFEERDVPAEILQAVERTAATLREAGAVIVDDVPMPSTRYSIPAYFVISRIEAYSNLQRYDGLKYGRSSLPEDADMYGLFSASRGEGFGYQAKLRVLTGLFLSRKEFYEKYYQRAQRARALIRGDYDRAFDPGGKYRLDLLLTPSAPSAAFPFAAEEQDSILVQYADCFTSPMNFAGTPAVSFPVGLNPEGLPIGVQAAGYDGCESTILRAAYAVEQVLRDRGEWIPDMGGVRD